MAKLSQPRKGKLLRVIYFSFSPERPSLSIFYLVMAEKFSFGMDGA